MSFRRFISASWFFFTATAFALPPVAQTYLEMLPERALTLDLVVHRAIGTSDSYRGLIAEKQAVDTPLWTTLRLFDPVFTASALWFEDRLQPATPFQSNRNETTDYRLGISKYFSTGTQVSMELSHGRTEISFPNPAFSVPAFSQTRGQLTLSQSVWKDFFGVASRAAIQASELSAKANRSSLQSQREQWFLDLTRVFYNAWQAQENVRASRQNLSRQQRLLDTVRLKVQRGTSEAPDVLQVESLVAGAEARLGSAVQLLGDTWRNLVMFLKLPAELMGIDPTLIPMKLDDPVTAAVGKCGSPGSLLPAPEGYSALEMARLRRQAAELNESRARSEYNPDLKFSVSAASNRVSTSAAVSTLDFIDGQFPRFEAGVKLSIPLGFHQERATLARASADAIAASAQVSMEEDTLKASWVNSCLELHRLVRERELHAQAASKQNRREKLEQERFELGRGNILQVITAGGDATTAALTLTASEVELRLAAWRIQRFTGQIDRYVSELEQRK